MSEALAGHEPEDTQLDPELTNPAADGPKEGDDGAAGEPDYEAEALAMGWKPPDRFKGAKTDFIDAKTYVERGKTILPFLRNELKRRDREIETLKKSVTESIKHISKADERAYAKAKAELEAELAQYAEAGDKANVKAVTDDLIALEKERVAAPKANDTPPEFQAWMDDNPWYGADKALTAACDAIGKEVFDEGYTGKAQIKEVDRRIREAFPAKFAKAENPARRQPGAVEGASSARGPRGKSYADLPADAKAMCDDMCREIKGMTRERYVKEFFEE